MKSNTGHRILFKVLLFASFGESFANVLFKLFRGLIIIHICSIQIHIKALNWRAYAFMNITAASKVRIFFYFAFFYTSGGNLRLKRKNSESLFASCSHCSNQCQGLWSHKQQFPLISWWTQTHQGSWWCQNEHFSSSLTTCTRGRNLTMGLICVRLNPNLLQEDVL